MAFETEVGITEENFLSLSLDDIESMGLERSGDLILLSGRPTKAMFYHGYRIGIFAMPIEDDFLPEGSYGWFMPKERGVIPIPPLPDSALANAPRSLRQSMKRYRCKVDRDFEAVISNCRRTPRPGGWIDDHIEEVFKQLYSDGVAHSVEVYEGRQLVGGLYGVEINGIFSGESMFHLSRDASKVALIELVRYCAENNVVLIETQWNTPHLKSLGAVTLPWITYLDILRG